MLAFDPRAGRASAQPLQMVAGLEFAYLEEVDEILIVLLLV